MARYAYPEGAFEIDPVPGQPQIAHCHGFFVLPYMRGKGHGHYLKRTQMLLLRHLHYDYASATVDSKNEAQIAVLRHAGWQMLAEFENQKTGGCTQIFGCSVNKD